MMYPPKELYTAPHLRGRPPARYAIYINVGEGGTLFYVGTRGIAVVELTPFRAYAKEFHDKGEADLVAKLITTLVKTKAYVGEVL